MCFERTEEFIEQGNIIYQTSTQELQQQTKIKVCSRLYVATIKKSINQKMRRLKNE